MEKPKIRPPQNQNPWSDWDKIWHSWLHRWGDPRQYHCISGYVLNVDSDEYYMSSVRQVDTLLTAATQSILLQITWSEAFKVCAASTSLW